MAAPALVPLIAPGFEGEQLAQTIDLTRLMLLAPMFLALGATATAALNGTQRFAASAVAPIVYDLAIIGAAVILAPSLGVTGLALGVVAGSLGHLLVQVPPLLRAGFRYLPRIDLSDAQARLALALMGPRVVGLGRDADHVRRDDRPGHEPGDRRRVRPTRSRSRCSRSRWG